MIQNFDYFGMPEDPTFILCNPNRTELYSLGTIYDRKLSLRYNALSSVSFTAPFRVDGVQTDYYNYLSYKRLIYIVNIGYFMISEIEESSDGIEKYKEITAYSLESEFKYKNVTSFKGTYKFYDLIEDINNPALLNTLISYAPGWSISYVDSALATLYRTFDVSDSTIYNMLMTDIEEAYQCVFTFDTINKTISAYSTSTATTNTDIYMSYDNLIEDINISEITEELVTALTVKGAGNLSINQVNPLGTDKIYNFDYFKTLYWMSQDLIDALDTWENLVNANQANYANLLTLLETYNSTLITQNSELVALNGEYSSLENVKIVRIQQGLSITDINLQLSSKQNEINLKNASILQTQTLINNVTLQLTAINTLVKLDNNLTALQKIELDPFVIESTYNNTNFIQTSVMSASAIQYEAQQLYDQAVLVLDKISEPRYEFSMSSANFVALEDYSIFTSQLELGCVITLDLDDNLNLFENNYVPYSGSKVFIYPVLLGLDMNFDEPEEFDLVFGNRLRLDNSVFQFSDLFGETNKSGTTTSFNSEQWGSWTNNYQDTVSTFISSSLDASLNNVISGSTQDVLINKTGIRIRNLISGSSYSGQQVWMNNGIIAFSDDNFNTAKLALGAVTTGSATSYGLLGEVLVGRILAGNNLTITNENSTFTVNGLGATLSNANFTIVSGNKQILLNPTDGIKIQKNVGGTWTDQLSMTTAGDLVMTGTITATTGKIGGWNILSDRLSDNLGNYIRSDGYIKLGALTITPTTATFDGNISANKLLGTVSYTQLTDIPADKITSGTMSGGRIYGGVMNWPGGTIGTSGTGAPEVKGNSSMTVWGGSSYIGLGGSSNSVTIYPSGGSLNLYGSDIINHNNVEFYGSGTFSGRIYANGGITSEQRSYFNNGITVLGSNGISTRRYVKGSDGLTTSLNFISGVYVGL